MARSAPSSQDGQPPTNCPYGVRTPTPALIEKALIAGEGERGAGIETVEVGTVG